MANNVALFTHLFSGLSSVWPNSCFQYTRGSFCSVVVCFRAKQLGVISICHVFSIILQQLLPIQSEKNVTPIAQPCENCNLLLEFRSFSLLFHNLNYPLLWYFINYISALVGTWLLKAAEKKKYLN